jgi:riboflavin synthase
MSHVERHTEEQTDRHRFFAILYTRPTRDNSVNVIEFDAFLTRVKGNGVFEGIEEAGIVLYNFNWLKQ